MRSCNTCTCKNMIPSSLVNTYMSVPKSVSNYHNSIPPGTYIAKTVTKHCITIVGRNRRLKFYS